MAEYDLEIIDIEEASSYLLYVVQSGEYLYALRVRIERETLPPCAIKGHFGPIYKIGDKIAYSNTMKEVEARMKGDRIVYYTADGKGWPND